MDFRESEIIQIRRSFNALERYVARRRYRGYDPYDALLSRFPFLKLGKWPPILAIQVMKRNPLNVRKIMGIPKMWNPKALGLFLHGYSLLPVSDENAERCRWLFEKLLELKTADTSGMAWGYPFPWASPEKVLQAWSPTSVVTGFVVQGLDAYYKTYKDERALDAMRQSCVFLTEDLFHTIDEEIDTYKISYSTCKPDFCYNASLLAAQAYALTYAHTGQKVYAEIARKALHTVLKRQKNDGSWNYSENLQSGKQRVQIDFHQGFILDSILAISEALDSYPEAVEKALHSGFEFYAHNQFRHDGRALWRLPDNYPADIHHQAQGILTAARFHHYSQSGLAAELSKSVLNFTIENFQDKRGFFYYRKHRYFIDRTSYMRWGNAWMFLAMATVYRAANIQSSDKELRRPLSWKKAV